MATPSVELFYDGAWNAAPAYEAEGWSYQVGPSLNSGVEPNTFGVTLANADLSMDPSNPTGALYRKITRNMPARLKLGSTVVCAGEASSWSMERTVGHTVSPARGRSTTDLKAEGILRRLGRWEDPLRSPLSRRLGSYTTLTGLWGMEDPANSQNIANQTAGGQAGTFSGTVTLDGADGSGGTNGALVLGSDGVVMFKPLTSTSNGYQLSWISRLSQAPGSATYIAMIQWTDSNNRTWYWRTNNGAYEIAIYNPDGTLLTSSTVTWGTGVSPTNWTRYRIKITSDGSTITYEPSWYQQDAAAIYGTSGSFGPGYGVTGQPRDIRMVANTYTDGSAWNMLFVTTDLTLNLLGNYPDVAAFNGYLGETAGARFTRLMAENGVTATVLGTSSASAAMGRQPSGTLVELLQEIIISDACLIYDDPAAVQLVCRLNNHMLDSTPVLTLTYGTNLAPPLKKIIDDQRSPNDITGQNWDGTEVRLVDNTSTLGTAVPPTGVGRYTGQLDLSLKFADGVFNRTSWELRNNMIDRPRYGALTVDLLANPSLLAAVNAIRPGDLLLLAGVEQDTVPLMVINISRSGAQFPDRAVLNCLPADRYYDMGKTDDGSHYTDSASTTLDEDLTTTETIWDIITANPDDKWVSGSGLSIPIQLGPELCTATNITVGSASGTGWAQAMTCTRSVNGVVMTHQPGEEVHVAKPYKATMRNVSMP